MSSFSDQDREALCRWLGLEPERELVMFGGSDSERDIWPPIDTDTAWAVKAQEAAAALLRARKESLDWTMEHYPDGWEIIPCHWALIPPNRSVTVAAWSEEYCNRVEGSLYYPFALGVCLALDEMRKAEEVSDD